MTWYLWLKTHELLAQRLPATRPPKDPDTPRASCPYCHRLITLNKLGRLRVHGGNPNCPGTGKRIVSFIIHEEAL